MNRKAVEKATGQGAVAENLVTLIEDERKKLEDISIQDLSRPDVIERQKAFDSAVIQFMRKRSAEETDQGN